MNSLEPYGKLPYTSSMDMKKKLEDTYIPDKKDLKDKVILAMSGGLDSQVVAYLLKIQKYDLIAVTIVNSLDEFSGDQVQTLSCYLNQPKIDQIKEFCNKLGIPLYVIKASNEFKGKVVDPWLTDKISGRFSQPCWNCHEHRLKLVHDKMIELGASKMATGHFAKIFHNSVNDSVFVHSSNDELHDQSAILSRLPHDILTSIILPLSDLSKKEVVKLAENFGLVQALNHLKIHDCLKINPELISFIEKNVSPQFIKPGEISNKGGNENFGEHLGIHHYSLGDELEHKESGKPIKSIVSHYSFSNKKLVITEPEFLQRTKLLLIRCHPAEEVSWTEPVKGFLNLSTDVFLECWVHPKSLSAFYIELHEAHTLISGLIVSVFKKKGKNSKVYLTGEIQLLDPELRPADGDEIISKVNYSIDF